MRTIRPARSRLFVVLTAFTGIFLSQPAAGFAQQNVITAGDYAHAETMLASATAPYVDRSGVRPIFLPDGRFWYRILTPTASECVLINPTDGTRIVGATPASIGITATAVSQGPVFQFAGGAVTSPDGKKAVFIKDFNLWVREVASGKEAQLTTDGIKDFGYATDNAGWKHSTRAVVAWSPDSKKVSTFQQDQRRVNEMYLVTTNIGSPRLDAWKYQIGRAHV